MVFGAILVVIYFRCCKRRCDLREKKERAMKQSIESTTKEDESNAETLTLKSDETIENGQ